MVEKAGIAMLKAAMFGQDANQGLCIHRPLFVTNTYSFGVLSVEDGISPELIRNVDLRDIVGNTVAVSLILYFLLRFNFGLSAKDPILIIPQSSAAAVNNSIIDNAGSARRMFLRCYLQILVFALFRLRGCQIHRIGALVLLMNAAIILVEVNTDRRDADVSLDILPWFILLFISAWFARITRHITSRRYEFKASNERLAHILRGRKDIFHTLEQQITYDELTGVFNRRSILEAQRHRLLTVQNNGKRLRIAIVYVNYFKKSNGSAEDLGGDNVLLAVTQNIAASLHSTNRLGRYRGEHLLTPMCANQKTLQTVRRLRENGVLATISDEDIVVPVTLLLCFAKPEAGSAIETLLAEADSGLYQAKNQYCNRVRYCDRGNLSLNVLAAPGQ